MMLVKFLVKQYMKGLRKKIDKAKVRTIKERYKNLLHENQSWIVDQPSVLNLHISTLVLASYQILKTEMSKQEWETIIRYALVDRTKSKQQFFMKLFLKWNRNPFKSIVQISKTKQVKHYGEKHFKHEIVNDVDHQYLIRIHKCFYFSFFQTHNALEVVPIFCSLDNIWGELLEDKNHGVSFERTQLLSTGHSYCQFDFKKIE